MPHCQNLHRLGNTYKGPVALLIVLLAITVYWVIVRFRKIISLKHAGLFIVSFLLVAGIWFIVDIMDNGIGFFHQFISYQVDLLLHPVAGHGEPFYYHFVVVFLGCFPMSIFSLFSLIRTYSDRTPLHFKRWMLILFWVVMILFSVVTTKIVHYSSLAYFPLSFLAAKVIYGNYRKKNLMVYAYHAADGKYFSVVFLQVPGWRT
jgi:4-amino-4-deoxy-L-arabinose transferase-like glycosyltransferase